MSEQLRSSIVRIHDKNGRIIGAGFLATEKKILTCAHVVAQALGILENTPKQPSDEIRLDFPLVARGEMLTARVVLWRPVDTSLKEGEDIAVLKLEQEVPPGTQSVRLVKSDELWGHAFRVLGFPAGYDDGTWASGILRDKTATGWIQVEDIKETGYRIQPGFSGTPIWDEQLSGVVGMAVAADMQPETKVAFIIPVKMLIKTWPALEQRSVNVDDLAYFQEQLATLEIAQKNAPDPRRFQAKIDELRTAIANWEGRVEKQRQRITDGLAEQRQLVEERSKQGLDEKRLRVIGRRPLGEVEYFKNRQREQNKIGQLLAEPTTRLVSVIGHGGMGKTALASKVLRDLEHYHWPHTDDEVPLDGIVYLSTRTAGISLERVFLDCAKMLGGEQEKRLNSIWTNPVMGIEDKISHLLKALRDGLYIILLDNIEDLVDDKGQLGDKDLQCFFDQSLTTAHGARLLVTSRLSLAFRREVMRFDQQVKLLEGLPVPDGVALLRELDPNGDYGLQDAPEELLTQAVSLVHGVPRALEVIAGILADNYFISLVDILNQFYQQEDVIQMLVEENYKRMDSNTRRVIEALTVFKRPVPPLAIDYLLQPFVPGIDVPSIIQRLARTNVVSVDRATKTVTIHPIDQDYAYSQLPESGTGEFPYTRQNLERRAAEYYVQLRTPPETWKTIDDLEPQLEEFDHRVWAGDYDNACRVLQPIDDEYLYQWGHYTRLIDMREKLQGQIRNPALQSDNLAGLGKAYYATGQYNQAAKLYNEALTITEKLNDRRSLSHLLGNLGRAYHQLGQITKSRDYYKKALDICREIGDRLGESLWLSFLSWAYRSLGEINTAIPLYEEAISIVRDVGARSKEGRYLGNLGRAYHLLGRIDEAIQCYEDALNIVRELGNRRYECFFMGYLGIAYRNLGQIEKAIELHTRALTIAREIGNRHGEVLELYHLGSVYHVQKQDERAIAFYKQGLNLVREVGDRRRESFYLLGLGQASLDAGNLSEACMYCEKARDLDMPETSYQAALTLAVILVHRNDTTAGAAFADAVSRCRMMLEKTANLYEARYALSSALVGQAVCDPNWKEESKRTELLAPTLDEYKRALENCSAPGVVQEAIRDLKLIREAGIEGLEPVFELLESKYNEVNST